MACARCTLPLASPARLGAVGARLGAVNVVVVTLWRIIATLAGSAGQRVARGLMEHIERRGERAHAQR
jgi:hypothetical protein